MRSILFASALTALGFASSTAFASEKAEDLFKSVCLANKQKGELTTPMQKSSVTTVRAIMQAVPETDCNVIWTKATMMTSMDLSGKEITNVSVLRAFDKMTDLNLSNNGIADISMLSTMKALQTLNVADNQIGDITVAGELAALTTFNGAKNQITDISALSNTSALTQVRLADNQIEKVFALTNHKGLKNAYLQNNKIANLTPLAKNKKLKELNVKGNPVKECPDKGKTEVKGKEVENTDLLKGICKDEAYK
jgi:Leucine-rich repeat (LRR) protein